ncbi:agmatinase [Streptomyces sp. V4I8]
MTGNETPRGPVDSSRIPRYAGPATFARLPRLDEVGRADVAVVGVPFDSGVSYRPGARFGGNAIREASRLLRPYNPAQDASPFALAQVADGGDIAVNPFNINEAVETVEAAADELIGTGARLMTLGGDHTIALPLLRSVAKKHGPVALLHFDAHLDTWDTYFGAEYTHGTPFRRAVEEGILDTSALSHVGIRGPLYGKQDLTDDEKMGFGIVTSADVYRRGADEVADQLRQRIGDRPPLHLHRHRLPRPGARPRHRHPRGGRYDVEGAAGDPARSGRVQPGLGRCRRGGARVRSRRDHVGGRVPHGVRTDHDHVPPDRGGP